VFTFCPEAPNLFGESKWIPDWALAQTLVRAADLDCSVALLASTVESGDMGDPRPASQVSLREPGVAEPTDQYRAVRRATDIYNLSANVSKQYEARETVLSRISVGRLYNEERGAPHGKSRDDVGHSDRAGKRLP